MKQLGLEVSTFSFASMLRSARFGSALLLSVILFSSPSARALPPASGSKCSSDWVNNTGAMACFIQGEEDVGNGVARPHYVACTDAGEVFCCVDKSSGQDCEVVSEVNVGGRGLQDIENLKSLAILQSQRSILNLLSRIAAKLDNSANRKSEVEH